MKKDLPNDGLDKFLKNSFEGYEENPSNDVWKNISKGLKEVPATTATGTTGTTVSIGMKWWLATAACVLLCVGFAQYYYFNNKIEEISQRIDNQEIIVNDILENKKDLDSQITKNPQSENTITPIKENSNSSFPDENKVVQTNKIERSKNSPTKNLKTNKLPVVNSQSTTSQEVVADKQVRNFVDEFPTQQFDESGNSSNFVKQNEENKFINESDSDRKDELSEKPVFNENTSTEQRNKIVIEQLNQVDNFLIIDENFDLKLPTVATFNKIIPVSKMKNGISIMPFAGYYQLKETVDFDHRNSPPPPVGLPNHHSRSLGSDSYGTIQQLGLKCDISIRNNWSIETGVAFRLEQLETRAEYLTQFRDRQMVGPNNHDYNFKFLLHTANGPLDIDVRAEPDRPNEPIRPEEEVPVVFDLKSKKSVISIPLRLKYISDFGSWTLGAGAGFAFNVPIQNEVEVDAEIKNNKFKTKRKPQKDPREISGVGIDGLASLNFGYKLTENMSLVASPTLMYQLKSNHPIDRFVKGIKVTSFGSDVGLRYNF